MELLRTGNVAVPVSQFLPGDRIMHETHDHPFRACLDKITRLVTYYEELETKLSLVNRATENDFPGEALVLIEYLSYVEGSE